jgi:hypothetical protein
MAEFMYRDEPLRVWMRDEYMSEVAFQLYGTEGGYIDEIFYNASKDDFKVKFSTSTCEVYIRVTAAFFEQLERDDDDSEEYHGVYADDIVTDSSYTSIYKYAGDDF